MDKKVTITFWKSSGSGVLTRIRILDPDRVRLGGGLRSPSALVIIILMRRSMLDIGVARVSSATLWLRLCALGARAPPDRRIFLAKFTGESCKCTPRQSVYPPGRARVEFF